MEQNSCEKGLCVSREKHPQDTIVTVGDVVFGGDAFVVIAGPCAVESEAQLQKTAQAVQAAGAQVLRGGAYKPRTSPYSFQGLGEAGLRLLAKARKTLDMLVVSELLDVSLLPLYADVDILQVGARNMQNSPMLTALGKQTKPVLLKRNPGATLEEFLLSAEYILAQGNDQVILCERGIHAAAGSTRYTLDLGAIPLLRQKTHLPVVVDPSHAAGASSLVEAMAYAAVAAGANGLLLEVHCDPKSAKSDGEQAIEQEVLQNIIVNAKKIKEALRN